MTDRRTNTPSFGDARTHLKRKRIHTVELLSSTGPGGHSNHFGPGLQHGNYPPHSRGPWHHGPHGPGDYIEPEHLIRVSSETVA